MSKEVVNVQMEREFYDKVMNGESVGGSGEEMIYFDALKLSNTQGFQYMSAFESLLMLTANAYKTSIPVGYNTFDSFAGSEKVIAGVSYYNGEKYVAFPNNVTIPKLIHLGSQPMPVVDIVGERMSLYEFFETINKILEDYGVEGSGIMINDIKTCEVTKEEVMQWFQTPVEE